MPILKHSGNVFRCYWCGDTQITCGRDLWHLVQTSTHDSHYYLICDVCYPAFAEAQMRTAMQKLSEFHAARDEAAVRRSLNLNTKPN